MQLSNWIGRFCEFEEESVPSCDLNCSNGGYCVFKTSDSDRDVEQACHCPNGYGGLYCEIEAVPCGDFLCYHGSTWVTEYISDGKEVNHCNSRTAFSATGKRYAGMFCQYEETMPCGGLVHDMESRLFASMMGSIEKKVF